MMTILKAFKARAEKKLSNIKINNRDIFCRWQMKIYEKRFFRAFIVQENEDFVAFGNSGSMMSVTSWGSFELNAGSLMNISNVLNQVLTSDPQGLSQLCLLSDITLKAHFFLTLNSSCFFQLLLVQVLFSYLLSSYVNRSRHKSETMKKRFVDDIELWRTSEQSKSFRWSSKIDNVDEETLTVFLIFENF